MPQGVRKLLFFTREVRRQDQDKNQFSDLRGLKGEHAEAYPGAGAVGRNAQPWDVDEKEQEDPGGIEIFFQSNKISVAQIHDCCCKSRDRLSRLQIV